MLSTEEYENIKAMLKAHPEDRMLALNILDKRKDIKDINNCIPYALLYRYSNMHQIDWMTHCPEGYKRHVKPLLTSGFVTIRGLFKAIISNNLNIECFDMFINELKTSMWQEMQAAEYGLVEEINIMYKKNESTRKS